MKQQIQETPDQIHESVMGGVKFTIESIARDLEKVTEELSRHFSTLEGTKLPEYQVAIDAVQKYRDALCGEMNRLYEQEKQEKLK